MKNALVLAFLILTGCAKVSVTPLGSTADGRRQYEVTCNKWATSGGDCDEAAREACGGSYETQGIANTGRRPFMMNGQMHSAEGDRVLLVACAAPATAQRKCEMRGEQRYCR